MSKLNLNNKMFSQPTLNRPAKMGQSKKRLSHNQVSAKPSKGKQWKRINKREMWQPAEEV